jgi:hypothetical protein
MPLLLKWLLVAIFLVGSAAQFVNGHVLLGSALALLCAIYLVLAIRHRSKAPPRG